MDMTYLVELAIKINDMSAGLEILPSMPVLVFRYAYLIILWFLTHLVLLSKHIKEDLKFAAAILASILAYLQTFTSVSQNPSAPGRRS